VGKNGKNADFRPNHCISETTEDSHIVTMEYLSQIVYGFSIGNNFSDYE